MIKKLSLLSLFTLLPASLYFAQTTVYAYVKDQEGKPIENVEITIEKSLEEVKSDKIGYFQFVDLMPGTYSITVSKSSLETKIIEFVVAKDEKRKDLGTVSLIPSQFQNAGVMVIDDAAGEGVEGGSSLQPTVGLLSAGRDIFQNVSAFELGAYWFRPRGVDNRFEEVLFNGVPMSKNDDGRIDFSNWGGLNDVTRYPYEYVDNLTPSEYTFGNLGGVVYYNTRASTYRKGVSLAYSATNRSYNNRAMATYNSGLLKNGWAFTFSGSRRWAKEGVIDGTYQDAYAYFGSIEKKFGENHSLNLTAFGAPTYRASNSPNTQEVYDLLGKDYNAFWGFQDGEKRNSRIRKVFEPIFQLAHYWKIDKKSNLNTTLSYQDGSDARSRLDWFRGKDPHPYYYRKLPSYGLVTADEFRANSQIDWTNLYFQNSNVNTQDFVIGTDAQGNAIIETGKRSIYSLVEDVNKDKTINAVMHFDTKLQDNWKLNVNLNYQNLTSDNFRRIKDLLGGDFALNKNAFDGDAVYDIDNPNYIVKEGDRTQYSYDLLRSTYAGNVSTEIDLNKWNVVASVFSAYSESQREGNFRSARFLNNSKGKSAVYTAFDAGFKGKITYKLNGKNFLVYNGGFFSVAPTLNEIFINPRVVDFVTPGVDNQIINSNDLSFISRGQIIKLRVSAYYNTISNATEISRYYADVDAGPATSSLSTLVAEAVSGADKRFMGAELGLDLKISPTLSANAVASVGQYEYTNNPNVSSYDDINEFRGTDYWGKVNLKGFKVAGTPQKAYSFGLKYNSPKYWWIGASANYLQDNYLDISALNRSEKFYTDPLTNDNYEGATPEAIAALTSQKKFEDQFMLNANAGKSFLFGDYRLGVSLSVSNILNNRNYVTGGFEQGRNVNFPNAQEDAQRATPYFGPKLWYDRGTQFFANVYLRF